jgi:dTDP-4-amino-4,6-dideoxy-D-galactose acyltransferase
MNSTELVEYLDWDSKFFGFKIGRIHIENSSVQPKILDRAIDEARALDIKCLYVELPFGLPEVLAYCSENSFLLVSIRTILSKKLDCGTHKINSKNITYKVDNIFYPYLIKIVKQISAVSRFNCDLKFGREKISLLYEEWLRKSCYEKYCDDLIIYVNNNEPAGFITIRIKDGHPYIDLIGVSNEQRKKGIGKCLIHDAERRLSKSGYKTLKVVTQGHNISALRTYQSMNFNIESLNMLYHKWID